MSLRRCPRWTGFLAHFGMDSLRHPMRHHLKYPQQRRQNGAARYPLVVGGALLIALVALCWWLTLDSVGTPESLPAAGPVSLPAQPSLADRQAMSHAGNEEVQVKAASRIDDATEKARQEAIEKCLVTPAPQSNGQQPVSLLDAINASLDCRNPTSSAVPFRQ